MAWLGILIFAGASFFFALAESALFSLGKWRVRQLAERSPVRGAEVARLLDEPQDLLATIVLGNTFTNAGIVATALWLSLEGEWPLNQAILAVLALILLGCEVMPKTLAVRAPDLWSLRLSQSMLVLKKVTGPLRKIAVAFNSLLLRAVIPKSAKPHTTLTDEEYQELLEMAYQQGALAHSEKEIILQIINLDRRTARDAMRPRPEMSCISDDLSIEEMIAAARKYKHRRLPMYDETPDTIVGILNTATLLLNPEADLAEAIEFPSFVPESMNLLQLLKSFQRQQRGVAVVLDEFGGTAGLITVENILEEVVGELHSEGEAQGFIMEKLGQGKWRVNGTMRLEDFRREYPALGEVPGVDTLGGLLSTHLGIVPAPGESAVIGGLRFTALVGDERRVRELLVEDLGKRGGG
jgi:putative hemolysin